VLKLHKFLSKETEIVELNRIVTDIWNQQLQSLKDGEDACAEDACAALEVLNTVLDNFGRQEKLLGSHEELIKVYNDCVLSIVNNLEAEDAVTSFTWALATNVKLDSGEKVFAL
jgi:hypothetical protein